jgi:hypothetical protein
MMFFVNREYVQAFRLLVLLLVSVIFSSTTTTPFSLMPPL